MLMLMSQHISCDHVDDISVHTCCMSVMKMVQLKSVNFRPSSRPVTTNFLEIQQLVMFSFYGYYTVSQIDLLCFLEQSINIRSQTGLSV